MVAHAKNRPALFGVMELFWFRGGSIKNATFGVSLCSGIFSFCCCWCCCIAPEFLRSSRNALLHKWFTLISFHQSLYFLPHLLFNDLSCDCTTLLFTLHLFIYSYMYFYTHMSAHTHIHSGVCTNLIQDVCLITSKNLSMAWTSPTLLLLCKVGVAVVINVDGVANADTQFFFRIFVMSLSLSLHTFTLWFCSLIG